MDPKLRIGALDNGFTYYLRRNSNPQNKFNLKLLVKAGFWNETGDQLELSHLIEHLAFRGTKHFQNPIDFFEKQGLRWGFDLNASTGYHYTAFDLENLPTDKAGLLESGLQFMRDCASDILPDPTVIDAERRVVVEELRRASGPVQRMRDQYNAKVINDYNRTRAEREKNLLGFKHKSLLKFYDKWYRPDLQALIVVGDIDVTQVEVLVKSLFSDLLKPNISIERLPRNRYLEKENKYVIVTDPESRELEIRIISKLPVVMIKKSNDLQLSIIGKLYNEMVRSRLAEVTYQFNPPLRYAQHTFEMNNNSDLQNSFGYLNTYLGVYPSSIKAGFRAALMELERVKRFGFSQPELSAARDLFDKSNRSNEEITSRNLLSRYAIHFLNGVVAMDPNYETNFVEEIINNLTLEEINCTAKEWLSSASMNIVMLAPDGMKQSIPEEATVLKWLEEIKNSTLKPFKFGELPTSLIPSEKQFNPAKIERPEITRIDGIGIQKFELANGVRVILKPIKNASPNKVYLHGFSPGGASLYVEHDYISAINAADIVKESGIGQFDKFQLDKYLSRKSVRCTPYIDDRTEGVKGSSSEEDFETLMQLVYQYFVSPNKNKEAFDHWLSRRKNRTLNPSPQQVLIDTILANTYNSSVLKKFNKNKYIDLTRLENAYRIYQERFSNAGDFTFVITGDFNPDRISALMVAYLGALPDAGKREKLKNTPDYTFGGPISKTIYAGHGDKALIHLNYLGKYEYGNKNNLDLEILSKVLETVLKERLRIKENAVYEVNSFLSYSKNVGGEFKVELFFSCAPDNVDKLIRAALDEVARLRTSMLRQDVLEKVIAGEKQSILRKLENDNLFWHNYLTNQYLNNEDPKDILHQVLFLDNISTEHVKSITNKYLSEDVLRFVLLPLESM